MKNAFYIFRSIRSLPEREFHAQDRFHRTAGPQSPYLLPFPPAAAGDPHPRHHDETKGLGCRSLRGRPPPHRFQSHCRSRPGRHFNHHLDGAPGLRHCRQGPGHGRSRPHGRAACDLSGRGSPGPRRFRDPGGRGAAAHGLHRRLGSHGHRLGGPQSLL